MNIINKKMKENNAISTLNKEEVKTPHLKNLLMDNIVSLCLNRRRSLSNMKSAC